MRRLAPLLPTLLLYLGLAGLLVVSAVYTNGQNVYPLDDTYIHLAIARHIPSGNWGVSSGEFSNASSSPLYGLLLGTLGWLTGCWIWLPLFVCTVAAGGLLYVVQSELKSQGLSQAQTSVWTSAVVLLTPVPFLIQTGMEHVVHTLLMILFVGLIIRALLGAGIFWAVVLAPLLVMTRFESLLAVGLAAIGLAYLRRWRAAAALLTAAGLPVALLSWWSIRHGQLWLPNSILLKSTPGDAAQQLGIITQMSFRWMVELARVPTLIPLLIALPWATRAARRRQGTWRSSQVLWPAAALLLLVGHLEFASAGWLYRYEAYLVAIALVSLAISIPKPGLVAVLLVGLPLGWRAADAMLKGPAAAKEIYQQHVQMAHFFSKYYPDKTVAANDIGAICYYRDARLLDLAGLTSVDVLRLKLAGTYNTATLEQLADKNKVEVAAIYEKWFDGKQGVRRFNHGPLVPAHWRRIGRWRTPPCIAAADNTISFFAVNGEEAQRLRRNLEDFRTSLPAEVTFLAD